MINTTCVTSGAGIAYPSGAPEFPLIVSGVSVTGSLVLCASFVDRCLSFCPLSFVLSALLRLTASDYPFDNVKRDLMNFQTVFSRRACRYQRGNQNPYFEEEQTTQWPKE
jgi:hypothetical protein